MTNSLTSPNYTLAAELMTEAEALLIGAGAGMGIDSGLPGFRGHQGFWAAYPPYHGRSFADLACPQTFTADPELAWGFYGHRLNLYRQTQPHAGFAIQNGRLVAIELGAGTALPKMRRECELAAWWGIRINPHDTEPPTHGVLLPVGAVEALTALETVMRS